MAWKSENSAPGSGERFQSYRQGIGHHDNHRSTALSTNRTPQRGALQLPIVALWWMQQVS